MRISLAHGCHPRDHFLHLEARDHAAAGDVAHLGARDALHEPKHESEQHQHHERIRPRDHRRTLPEPHPEGEEHQRQHQARIWRRPHAATIAPRTNGDAPASAATASSSLGFVSRNAGELAALGRGAAGDVAHLGARRRLACLRVTPWGFKSPPSYQRLTLKRAVGQPSWRFKSR